MSAPYQGLGPTLAECLTAEKIALTAELAQVKAERDRLEKYWTQCAVQYEAKVNSRTAERDTAISHLEAVLPHSFAFERGHDFPQEAAARAFLLSMREKADQ